MPCFTWTLPNLAQVGPVVTVFASMVASAEDALRSAGQPLPPPIQLAMMIDTGASGSTIAPGIASQLGLQPVGVQQVSTPSTTTPVTMPTYAAKISLPNGGPTFETTVIEAPMGGQSIQGLIGRDVLSQCVLVYIGYANQWTLSH